MDILQHCQNSSVNLSDVVGLERTKQSLLENIVLPIRFPQLFIGGYPSLSKGILLYGPPGTGKSYLIKAISTEANYSKLFSICLLEILKKLSLESANFIKRFFESAGAHKPCIIFIDKIELFCQFNNEIDSDAAHQAKTEFQIQMDVLRKNNDKVFVVAASNFPWYLDSPIKKRLDLNFYFPLPKAEERQTFFKLYLNNAQHSLTTEDFVELGNKSEGYSGGDISIVVQNALASSIHQENSDSDKVSQSPSKYIMEPKSSDHQKKIYISNSEENEFETESEHFNLAITKKDILNAILAHKLFVNEDYLEKIRNYSSEL